MREFCLDVLVKMYDMIGDSLCFACNDHMYAVCVASFVAMKCEFCGLAFCPSWGASDDLNWINYVRRT